MSYLGTLVEWNDQRGFGFVEADEGGEKIFVHISAYQLRPTPLSRPHTGQRLKFEIATHQGKKRAQQVQWRSVERKRQPSAAPKAALGHSPVVRGGGQYLLLMAFAIVASGVAVLWGVQRWVFSLYAVMSLITMFAYCKDKEAAKAGRWRTPESTLHSLALLGGWPGAVLAQQWLRHKSSKRSFRLIFWLTVLCNVTAFVWLHSPWARNGVAMFAF